MSDTGDVSMYCIERIEELERRVKVLEDAATIERHRSKAWRELAVIGRRRLAYYLPEILDLMSDGEFKKSIWMFADTEGRP